MLATHDRTLARLAFAAVLVSVVGLLSCAGSGPRPGASDVSDDNRLTVGDFPFEMENTRTGEKVTLWLTYTTHVRFPGESLRDSWADAVVAAVNVIPELSGYLANAALRAANGQPIPANVSVTGLPALTDGSASGSGGDAWFFATEGDELEYCEVTLQMRDKRSGIVILDLAGEAAGQAASQHKWVPLNAETWPDWWNLIDARARISERLGGSGSVVTGQAIGDEVR